MFLKIKSNTLNFTKGIKKIVFDESGQGLIEYIILAVLLVIGSIVAVRKVGGNITGKFTKVDSELQKGQ